jgi:hypothetical protein
MESLRQVRQSERETQIVRIQGAARRQRRHVLDRAVLPDTHHFPLLEDRLQRTSSRDGIGTSYTSMRGSLTAW